MSVAELEELCAHGGEYSLCLHGGLWECLSARSQTCSKQPGEKSTQKEQLQGFESSLQEHWGCVHSAFNFNNPIKPAFHTGGCAGPLALPIFFSPLKANFYVFPPEKNPPLPVFTWLLWFLTEILKVSCSRSDSPQLGVNPQLSLAKQNPFNSCFHGKRLHPAPRADSGD